MLQVVYILIAAFCFLHIYRDYLQIKNGYNTWFTKFGHVWHRPQYEKHGIVVFLALGCLFIFLAARA